MANLDVHFEIHVSGPQRLIEFYAELFGWEFTQFGDMPWSLPTKASCSSESWR
jgi:predicted enzyme related to lactoylglutathione lyase